MVEVLVVVLLCIDVWLCVCGCWVGILVWLVEIFGVGRVCVFCVLRIEVVVLVLLGVVVLGFFLLIGMVEVEEGGCFIGVGVFLKGIVLLFGFLVFFCMLGFVNVLGLGLFRCFILL